MKNLLIYKPSKVATQYGRAKTKEWAVRFQAHDSQYSDPLMRWVASDDTTQQLLLKFTTLKNALAYAKNKGFPYTICNPTPFQQHPKNYANNFTCPRIRKG